MPEALLTTRSCWPSPVKSPAIWNDRLAATGQFAERAEGQHAAGVQRLKEQPAGLAAAIGLLALRD